MLINCLITINNLCDTKLNKWILNFAKPLVTINLDVAAQTGADNSRDVFAHHMSELMILRSLLETAFDDYSIQPEIYKEEIEEHLSSLKLAWEYVDEY